MSNATYQKKAQEVWDSMDKNQRTGVRIGLFPAEVMKEAEAEGYQGKELCVALMEVAERNGGMIA
jgi:hypothetical protein